MRNSVSSTATVTDQRHKWGVLRLFLGQAQICGATVTLVFLLSTGASAMTMGAAIISALLTLASLLFFKSRWRIIP